MDDDRPLELDTRGFEFLLRTFFMPLSPQNIYLRFKGSPFGLSAERIYEHFTYRQLNPFGRPASSVRTAGDAEELIDVIRFGGSSHSLVGLTLADLNDEALTVKVLGEFGDTIRLRRHNEFVRAMAANVLSGAMEFAERRATRNAPAPFLPAANGEDRFRVPFLRSRLLEHLDAQSRAKAGAEQWAGTLRNLTGKGVRKEELERSGLFAFLAGRRESSDSLSAQALSQAVDFSALRMSIVPAVEEAGIQLRFEHGPDRPVTKIKGEPKAQTGQSRQLHLVDSVLGYRIERVVHPALWGNDRHYQAVTYDGKVLRDRRTRRAIFDSPSAAMARAEEHAKLVLPKLLPSDHYLDFSWTGGEDYREWLITLPFYPESVYSSHFVLRNILAHVRCDLREGSEGEKVLMLQEIQSDWMQSMRRRRADGEELDVFAQAPYLNEWPTLTLKLMLLHAAHSGRDALGWTLGEHQVRRYGGRGSQGLKELYDRTLPREARRVLAPLGLTCGSLDVYVPDNFTMRSVEDGFEVATADGEILGTAPSLEEARNLFPDGAREELYTVHGVRLSKAARTAILEKGFAAWG